MALSRASFSDPSKVFEAQTSIGQAYFRRLTDLEKTQKFELWYAPKGEINEARRPFIRAKAIALTCVDEHGNQVFEDTDEGLRWLASRPGNEVAELFEIAATCVGLNHDDISELLKKKSSDSSTATDSGCTTNSLS